jgi:hypothetical protein
MRRAMPEATILYVVTAVVVTGLVVWLAVVLRGAKESWGRPQPPRFDEPELAPPAPAPQEAPPATSDADATAQATVVTVGQAEAKAADSSGAEPEG